jgi:hypothetical protein
MYIVLKNTLKSARKEITIMLKPDSEPYTTVHWKTSKEQLKCYSVAANLGHALSAEACARLESAGYIDPAKTKSNKLVLHFLKYLLLAKQWIF